MRSRIAPAAAAALCLHVLAACATSARSSDARACAGFVPPRLLKTASFPLPPSYMAAHVGARVIDEIVVGRDGSLGHIQHVQSAAAILAPFAEAALKRSQFAPASIEGNAVAARVFIVTTIGTVHEAGTDLPYDSLRAFVPGGASREARWQLAGSVERITLVVHVGSPAPQGVAVVAIAPGGAEKTLLDAPPGGSPDIRETVKIGKFLAAAGDYRLELRAGGKALASSTVTIAARFGEAVVNACEPLEPEKQGRGDHPGPHARPSPPGASGV